MNVQPSVEAYKIYMAYTDNTDSAKYSFVLVFLLKQMQTSNETFAQSLNKLLCRSTYYGKQVDSISFCMVKAIP